MTTPDSVTTQGALAAEISLREQGDARLSSYTGKLLVSGVPGPDGPKYSAHGVLITLVDGDSLELGLWKLDTGKQVKLDIKDGGTTVRANPAYVNFGDGVADGFKITVEGTGVLVQLDALSKWWTGDPGDGSSEEVIESTGSQVEFSHDRFATGVKVTKTLIGHISASWKVVSSVKLVGRKAKAGVNP